MQGHDCFAGRKSLLKTGFHALVDSSRRSGAKANVRSRMTRENQTELHPGVEFVFIISFGGFMFSKALRRAVASLLVLSLLGGCAEINRRGGIVDQIEDTILFRADTKSHRLFRSYLLAGVLIAAARQAGHNDIDRFAIEANMKSVLEIAHEAHMCLYPPAQPAAAPAVAVALATTTQSPASPAVQKEATQDVGTPGAVNFADPKICQFFDEKMARLDYALYRLAFITLFNAENRLQLTEIRDKLAGKIPVVSDSVKAAIHANKAVNQATSIVDDLLNLSFSSAGPLLILLPLYRDSLELNMWVIVDNLTRACAAANPSFQFEEKFYQPSYGISRTDVCQTYAYALQITNKGNGDLGTWREFVRNMNYATFAIEAYKPHFFLVTKLIWQSCQVVLGDMTGYKDEAKDYGRCQNALSKAIEKAAFKEYGISGEGGRYYTAMIRGDTRFARRRQQDAPVVVRQQLPATAPRDAIDLQNRIAPSSGSIPTAPAAPSAAPAAPAR